MIAKKRPEVSKKVALSGLVCAWVTSRYPAGRPEPKPLQVPHERSLSRRR